jgi:hypothetical protein
VKRASVLLSPLTKNSGCVIVRSRVRTLTTEE